MPKAQQPDVGCLNVWYYYLSSQDPPMLSAAHLIQWNSSHSTFEIIGHYDSFSLARAAQARCKSHFNYTGNDLQIISSYELGQLEAIS